MSRSQAAIDTEDLYSAHNYHPLPVVLDKGLGARVWDVDGKEYLDFLSAYSAVNQGHCHPRIIDALVKQSQKLTLSSRAFHNSQFGLLAARLHAEFGYDKCLPMNTGAEAVETSLKLARKWGYEKKGIAKDRAIVLSATDNFHGRTLGIVSMSTDPESYNGFGPATPGLGPSCPKSSGTLRYGVIEDLEAALEAHGKDTAAFLIEPIQGEAGIIVPNVDYLKKAHSLCKAHNVLLIADEIQTGLGRTGKMLCVEHSGIRPDMILLGKALSGGLYPVSCVLADDDVMLCIKPGQHGSTYGGNPLACAVAMAALDVLKEEKLSERADELGQVFRNVIEALASPLVTTVRGMGLLNAVVIHEAPNKTAWDLCMIMKERGLLAKPTHQNIIRFAPPLVISKGEMQRGLDIIRDSLAQLEKA